MPIEGGSVKLRHVEMIASPGSDVSCLESGRSGEGDNVDVLRCRPKKNLNQADSLTRWKFQQTDFDGGTILVSETDRFAKHFQCVRNGAAPRCVLVAKSLDIGHRFSRQSLTPTA